MHCKEIVSSEFERISAELDDLERQSGPIETVSGYHVLHGWTVLLRDASRCMVLFDNLDDQDRAQLPDASLLADGVGLQLVPVSGDL